MINALNAMAFIARLGSVNFEFWEGSVAALFFGDVIWGSKT